MWDIRIEYSRVGLGTQRVYVPYCSGGADSPIKMLSKPVRKRKSGGPKPPQRSGGGRPPDFLFRTGSGVASATLWQFG